MHKTNKYTMLSRTSKRKKRKKIRGILILTVVILIGIGGLTGYASHKINTFFNQTSEDDSGKDSDNTKATEKFENESFAMLLIGEDYRPETGSRNTDAIIVSVVNPETNKVSLLSIPRDTKVKIPGYGIGKINSVYSKGEQEKREQINKGLEPTIDGTKLLMEVLSDYLDISIEYYAKVDFKGFELVIDELGGLEIDVERDMVYHSVADNTNIELKKGLQTLNGKEALDYSRFRKSDDGNDSSDFERNERHQKIVKAFIDDFVSIKGATEFFDILEISGDHLKTNFSPDEMKALLWKYKSIAIEDIETITIESSWQNPYVVVEKEELIRVQNVLKEAYKTTIEVRK